MSVSRWHPSAWLATLLPFAPSHHHAHAHAPSQRPPPPPPAEGRPLQRPLAVFAAALLIRCVHALLVQTAFNPDEYWQSLEVAHNAVFGCVRVLGMRGEISNLF